MVSIMRLSISVLPAFLSLLAGVGHTQAPEALTSAQWREDTEFLRDRLIETHPNAFARVTRERFEAEWQGIRDSLDQWDDRQIAVRLMPLVASVQDGHTNLEPSDRIGFDRWFPVRFYRFADGVFVTAIDRSHGEHAGAKVLRIGVMQADSAADLAATVQGADNEFGALEEVFFLSNADALHALGVIESPEALPLEVVTRSGERRRVFLEPVRSGYQLGWRFRGEMFGPPSAEKQLITAFDGRVAMAYRQRDSALPLHLRYRLYYDFVHLEEHDAVYFQFNFTQDDPNEPFTDFYQRMFRYIDEHDVGRLIVDIRYNGGGDGSMLLPFVHELVKRDHSVNRPGRLFTIVGRKTFSAGVMLVGLMKQHTNTVFVGEPAGAALNHYGDNTSFTLPNSGMQLSVSTMYWQYSRWGDPNRLEPIQVPAMFTSEDYFGGRDPALDAILDPPLMPVIGVLEEQGGEAARDLFEAQRLGYEQYSWWQPFAQFDMNRLAYDLIEAGRSADAVVAFELNADRFGHDWRVWDGLGDGYKAAGRSLDAANAFRRALETAPDNWNAAYQRRMIQQLGR